MYHGYVKAWLKNVAFRYKEHCIHMSNEHGGLEEVLAWNVIFMDIESFLGLVCYRLTDCGISF